MLAEDRQREQARLARQRELDAEAAKDRQLEVEAERKRAERKAEMDRKDQVFREQLRRNEMAAGR